MYSVILIDDEIWALKGLQSIIDWQHEGFDLIAACTNPIEAMELIKTHKPDVVFTDIRMDDITGIDILKMARLNNIRSEFIIVSAYRDFEAAREAVQYGAFHYLLKPLDRSAVVAVTNRLTEHLNNKGDKDKSEYLDIDKLEGGLVKDWIIKAATAPNCYVVTADRQNCSLDIAIKGIACKSAILSNGCKMFLLASEKRLEGKFYQIRQSSRAEGVNIGISKKRANFEDFSTMFEEAEFSLMMAEDFSNNQNVSDVQCYIMNNYMKKITLKNIAQKLYLSDTYLCGIFKKHVGITITSYIKQVRMRKTIKLFSSPELTLQEIAQKVGYYNYAYFGRVFRQSYNKSPEKYRKCMVNNNELIADGELYIHGDTYFDYGIVPGRGLDGKHIRRPK